MSREYDTSECSVVREAHLFKKLSDESVRCLLCNRKCMILKGQTGYCKTRKNTNGILYTIVYGDISAIESRPIEIKPFFHFHPGSTALTIATWSCNFACPWCQNYDLSRASPDPLKANYISPDRLISIALKSNDSGICLSFQEPTLLFEYALTLFNLAKKNGLYTCIVSNGYMTRNALLMLKRAGLDAIKIDVKGNDDVYKKYCGDINSEKIWGLAGYAKELGIHVEIVNLVITGVNDDVDSIRILVGNHVNNVGIETPIHFTGYHPAYEFRAPPTVVEKLEAARNCARDAGILYAYIGNVPDHKFENTYCPRCGSVVIERSGYSVVGTNLSREKECAKCAQPINISGNLPCFGD